MMRALLLFYKEWSNKCLGWCVEKQKAEKIQQRIICELIYIYIYIHKIQIQHWVQKENVQAHRPREGVSRNAQQHSENERHLQVISHGLQGSRAQNKNTFENKMLGFAAMYFELFSSSFLFAVFVVICKCINVTTY